jgi:DNA-binding NtrC family response regulator
MAKATALVVERDPALRRLMRNAVHQAGYEIAECSNSLQLKVELRTPNIVEASALLLVVSKDIARQCTEELVGLFRDRAKAGHSTVDVAFTSEFGAPEPAPAIGPYTLVGVLEKPFSLDELERIARQCLGRDSARRAPVEARRSRV